jgi:hypothetical protein
MTNPDPLLTRVVEEMMELHPGLRQHVSDLVLGDLKEEVARIVPDEAGAIIDIIEQAEQDWASERG